MSTKRYIQGYSHGIFVILKIWGQLKGPPVGKCTLYKLGYIYLIEYYTAVNRNGLYLELPIWINFKKHNGKWKKQVAKE